MKDKALQLQGFLQLIEQNNVKYILAGIVP
ncbi:hypothetical protein SK38_00494 [Citrobacter sp. MGH110]|nr:hypothetical protein SK38_00494 [Citrobacter sp. MGH110]